MSKIIKKTRTKKLDPEQTREKILRAAKKLFVKKGMTGTSLREIAGLSGVTQSLIHHHFSSKEALWQKVKAVNLADYFDEVVKQYLQASEEGVTMNHRLLSLTERRFKFMGKHPEIVRMLSWQALEEIKGGSGSRGMELLKSLIDGIKKAQEKNEISKEIDPVILIFVIFILTTAWYQGNHDWLFAHDPKYRKDPDKKNKLYLEAIQLIITKIIS